MSECRRCPRLTADPGQKELPIPSLTEALVGMTAAQRDIALTRLEEAKLLTVNRDSAGMLILLDAHPLIREYFATRLRDQHLDAWRAAHRRLFEHLCARKIDNPNPTINDHQGLIQAVGHGCYSGLYREAFEDVFLHRICLGDHKRFREKFGEYGTCLGMMQYFFTNEWNSVESTLSPIDHALVVIETGGSLLGLGRVLEAEQTLKAGFETLARNMNDAN